MATVFPFRRRKRARASSEPRASPSGLTWVVRTRRRLPRSSSPICSSDEVMACKKKARIASRPLNDIRLRSDRLLLDDPRFAVGQELFEIALSLLLHGLRDLAPDFRLVERPLHGIDDSDGPRQLREARHARQDEGEHGVPLVVDD